MNMSIDIDIFLDDVIVHDDLIVEEYRQSIQSFWSVQLTLYYNYVL